MASSHTSFELWIEDTAFYHDTLLTVHVFPNLQFLPALLLSPLDIYALIKAWRQVKFLFPLLGCFALLTFGDMNTKKLKRPWRGVRQDANINVASELRKKKGIAKGIKTKAHAKAYPVAICRIARFWDVALLFDLDVGRG